YEAGLGSTERLATPSSQKLTIEARSEPPLSEQDILALIGRRTAVEQIIGGGGNAQTPIRGEVENILTASVAPTLFMPLERAVEDYLGLEEFTVDCALREPVQLRLTKQIRGPFYVTYTHNLNVGGQNTYANTVAASNSLNLYTVDVFYRISDRFRFGYRF